MVITYKSIEEERMDETNLRLQNFVQEAGCFET